MKCEALIIRTYKTRKAACVWPRNMNGVETHHKNVGPCGGEVTAVLKAVEEPYYGGVSAALSLELTCTRCKYPFVTGLFELQSAVLNNEVDALPMLDAVKKNGDQP